VNTGSKKTDVAAELGEATRRFNQGKFEDAGIKRIFINVSR